MFIVFAFSSRSSTCFSEVVLSGFNLVGFNMLLWLVCGDVKSIPVKLGPLE